MWYKTVGTGGRLAASTCSDNFSIDSIVSVYSACQSPTCIAHNDDGDDSSCDSQSLVEWDSTQGAEYYILVHTFFSGDQGSFELSVSEISQPEPPMNIFQMVLCFIRSVIDIFLPGEWSC